MKRQDLARLIKECRPLLRTATPEQKLRMLKLIREGYRKLNQPQEKLPYILNEAETIINEGVAAVNKKIKDVISNPCMFPPLDVFESRWSLYKPKYTKLTENEYKIKRQEWREFYEKLQENWHPRVSGLIRCIQEAHGVTNEGEDTAASYDDLVKKMKQIYSTTIDPTKLTIGKEYDVVAFRTDKGPHVVDIDIIPSQTVVKVSVDKTIGAYSIFTKNGGEYVSSWSDDMSSYDIGFAEPNGDAEKQTLRLILELDQPENKWMGWKFDIQIWNSDASKITKDYSKNSDYLEEK